ncbi:MAG: CoA transferase [Trueperaceae bacterium]|nr:CoA transferase [Trueperaceae bacterium]
MLDDLLVLDLSRVLAGPYATQALRDLGARVVKVEAPHGDDTRGWGPPFLAGEGSDAGYFASVNRGKESLAVDLKRPEGRDVVRRLALEADVLVENFKVGDLARYGLAPSDLAADHPSLIYASIRGYGSTGPRAHDPGYDAALQAATGLMAMTGEADGEPVKVGVAWIDVLSGLHAATAILAAVHHRDRTGEGRHLDLSLYEVGLASLVNQAQGALLTGAAPARLGSAHPSIVPYQAFATATDPLMLAVGNDAQFARAAAVLDLPDVADDPRYAHNAGRVEHREVLVPRIAARLAERPRDAWLAAFREAGVSATPVLDLPDALRDPQAEALGTVGTYSHPDAGDVPFVRSPLRHHRPLAAAGDPPPANAEGAKSREDAGRPPRRGEHGPAILREVLGMADGEVDALIDAAVLHVD